MELLKPEQVASSKLARLGLYGDNGVGKTTFLASIPESEGQGLVVSSDQENVKPLLNHPWITIAKHDKWDDLITIYTLIKNGKSPFKWVAYDTETRNQAFAGYKLSGQVVKPEDTVKWLSNPPASGKGFQYWENIGALCAEHVRQTCLLPVHVIFLFQEMTREPKFEQGTLETTPALTPLALREVKSSLEIVGRLYVDTSDGASDGAITLEDISEAQQLRTINPNTKETRRLLLGKHPRYFAKGPTHKLGYTVENPTWEALAPAWS